jgi:hypothetical protein
LETQQNLTEKETKRKIKNTQLRAAAMPMIVSTSAGHNGNGRDKCPPAYLAP